MSVPPPAAGSAGWRSRRGQGRSRLLIEWMRDLGLDVTIDRIGNIFGMLAGTEALPPVMIGSHIDTVATGGLYDGCWACWPGSKLVETLNEAGLVPAAAGVVAFTNEEGARVRRMRWAR